MTEQGESASEASRIVDHTDLTHALSTPRFFLESSEGDVSAAVEAFYDSGGAEGTSAEAQQGDQGEWSAAVLASRQVS